MAKIGMKYPVMAKLQPDGTYKDGKIIGKAISFTGTPNRYDADLYADDTLSESDKTIKEYGVSLSVDDIGLDIQAELLGHEYIPAQEGYTPERIEMQQEDEAPFVGHGFFKRRKRSGIISYTAIWLYKVQYTDPAETAETKGDATNFQVVAIEGKAFPVEKNGKKTYGEKATFRTEREAKIWINNFAAIKNEGATAGLMNEVSDGINSVSEGAIENFYAIRRTGKVYQSKIWLFDTNPTSQCEKLMDNAGMKCTPSTDTEEGEDSYLNGMNPLFEWVNVNYVTDTNMIKHPIAIEGMAGYKTKGNVDVGVMHMSFYYDIDTSMMSKGYVILTVSDVKKPRKLGGKKLKAWSECVGANGKEVAWCIGSKYQSTKAADGMLRSQPGPAELFQSYQNIMENYSKKGEGYKGAGAERNTYQMIMQRIKYATKNGKNVCMGCINYNIQCDASIQTDKKNTYFPVSKDNASKLVAGSAVSIGYGTNNGGNLGKDRSSASMRSIIERANIIKIVDIDKDNAAVYLDIDSKDAFDTMPVKITDTLESPIIMSTMPWSGGSTDNVIGMHDGSLESNNDMKHPYRINGREYQIGAYTVASDTVIVINEDKTSDVYVAPKGTARTSNEIQIKETYKKIGTIPKIADNNPSFWGGDIWIDPETGGWLPSAAGSGSAQGTGCYVYTAGAATSGVREYLQGGNLWVGLGGGPACLDCRSGVSLGWWYCVSGD